VPEGYDKRAEGTYCEIWLHSSQKAVFLTATDSDRRRVERFFDHMAEEGPEVLTSQQYKNEGRHDVGGKKIPVYAIGAKQLRVYGGWVGSEPRIFLCPEVAIKKAKKADQEQLHRVAKKLGEQL
jgi:hypothetical protein